MSRRGIHTEDGGKVTVRSVEEYVQICTIDMDSDRTVVTMTVAQAERIAAALARAIEAALARAIEAALARAIEAARRSAS